MSARDVGVRLALPTRERVLAANAELRASWEASMRRRLAPYGAVLVRRQQYVVMAPPQWVERLRAELAVTNASVLVEEAS